MAPNFSKNAILKGTIDFFCLPCEAYLTTVKDIEEHITVRSHINNLILVQNVCGIEDDYIKKIKCKYFCQLCNKVFSVLTRVRLHITEPLHIENKLSNVIQRWQDHIIVFNKIAITENSWNGFQDGSCIICSTEYEVGHEYDHKHIPSHIINLIQTKPQIDENQNIYRTVDELSFQCLTCNSIHSVKSMVQHFISFNHMTSYQSSYDLYKVLTGNGVEESLELSHINIQNNDFEDVQIPESICDIVIKDEESLEQFDCSEMANKDIVDRQSEVSKVLEIIATAKDDCEKESSKEDLLEYDLKAEKRIRKVLNSNAYISKDINDKSWCIICDWKIENCSVIEHIESRHHQELQIMHLRRQEELQDKQSKSFNKKKVKCARINNLKIFNDLSRLRDNQIKICYEDETVSCNKCSLKLPFIHTIIQGHIEDHDAKESVSEIKQENEDELIGLINKTVCIINKEGLPINVAEEAYEIKNEDDNVEMVNPEIMNESELERISTYIYVDTIIPSYNMMYRDFVINNKFCINQSSYCFIVHLSDRVTVKCVVCSEDFPASLFELHITESKHKSYMRDTMVIEMESEFIRELRPSYYQCGYCNIYDTSWNNIIIHLQSISHKESKTNSIWRLQQYHTEVANGTFKIASDEGLIDLTS